MNQKMQNTVMTGRIKQENGSGDGQVDAEKRNLIINYLPQTTTVSDLIMLFKPLGELESVKIMRHPRTGYSYGYGFVKFVSEDSAAKAIELFNRYPFRNKVLKVSYARPSSQVTKNANVYISNLPRYYSEDHLLSLFGQYGEILQHRLLRDKVNGMPRGVAFVRYAREEYAKLAIDQLNGAKLSQYPLRVRIADDYSQLRATNFIDVERGLQPFHYLNRSFAQMSLRNNNFHHRYFGGGGDFTLPFPSLW